MRGARAATVVLVTVLAGGCGSGDPSDQAVTEAPTAAVDDAAAVEAAVREVADRWWSATKPSQVCAIMSQGLKMGMGASKDCPAAIRRAVKAGTFGLEKTKATATDVAVAAPKALVVYDVKGRKKPVYLLMVRNVDTWLVDGQTDKAHLPKAYADLLSS